jgi:hypothetical protein
VTDGRRAPGARRAESAPQPLVVRLGKVVLPLAILAVVATLVVFGDSLFSGEPDSGPDQGQSAAAPLQTEDDTAGESAESSESEVAEVATAVLNAWARPNAAYDGWWRRLEPLLTPGGQQAYAYTEPAQVPELQEIEVEDVVLHTPGVTATVYFTTSEGRFGVDMSRRRADATWLANRVVFPGGESMFG